MDKIIQCDVEYQYPIVLMEESETCKVSNHTDSMNGICFRAVNRLLAKFEYERAIL